MKNSPGSSKDRNDQVPGDGSLWWLLNVPALWMSTLYYFVWHISNKRRENSSKRQQKQNICSGFGPTQHSWIMQVACQHDPLEVVEGGCGWQRLTWAIIVWRTQEWGRHALANLALVAPLIGPLFMQSSGGTYSKNWSRFDRVFPPLNNPQPPHPHSDATAKVSQLSEFQKLVKPWCVMISTNLFILTVYLNSQVSGGAKMPPSAKSSKISFFQNLSSRTWRLGSRQLPGLRAANAGQDPVRMTLPPHGMSAEDAPTLSPARPTGLFAFGSVSQK